MRTLDDNFRFHVPTKDSMVDEPNDIQNDGAGLGASPIPNAASLTDMEPSPIPNAASLTGLEASPIPNAASLN